MIRLRPPSPETFRGSADEPLVWMVRPDRDPRWYELIHYFHVHHNGTCLKNRFGPRCTQPLEEEQQDA